MSSVLPVFSLIVQVFILVFTVFSYLRLSLDDLARFRAIVYFLREFFRILGEGISTVSRYKEKVYLLYPGYKEHVYLLYPGYKEKVYLLYPGYKE